MACAGRNAWGTEEYSAATHALYGTPNGVLTNSPGLLEILFEKANMLLPDVLWEDGVMSLVGRIEMNPRVCNGKPVIRGTRIPISVILEQVAEGLSWDEVLSGYPELSRADIQGFTLCQIVPGPQ